MKKSVFILFIGLLITSTALCQLGKSDWMVGGSLGYNSSKYYQNQTAEIKTSDFQFSATAGYFILPKFPIGVRTTLQSNKQHYKDASGARGEGSSNYWSVGPFARYYFLKKTQEIVNLLVETSYSFGSARPDISANTFHFNRFSILAGPVIYFNSSVGLEFTLGYFHDKPSDGRNATSGFQTAIGFQIHLEKTK